MKSIKFKLILTTSVLVLAALVFVSVAVLTRQTRSQRENLAENAGYMMNLVHTE